MAVDGCFPVISIRDAAGVSRVFSRSVSREGNWLTDIWRSGVGMRDGVWVMVRRDVLPGFSRVGCVLTTGAPGVLSSGRVASDKRVWSGVGIWTWGEPVSTPGRVPRIAEGA